MHSQVNQLDLIKQEHARRWHEQTYAHEEKYFDDENNNISSEKAKFFLTDLTYILISLQKSIEQYHFPCKEVDIYASSSLANKYFTMVNEISVVIKKTLKKLNVVFEISTQVPSYKDIDKKVDYLLTKIGQVLNNDEDRLYIVSLNKILMEIYNYLYLIQSSSSYVLTHVNDRCEVRREHDASIMRYMSLVKTILSSRNKMFKSRMGMDELLKQINAKNLYDNDYTKVTSLSVDNWYYIFGFLKLPDLIKTSKVCHQFNEVSKSYLERDYTVTPKKSLLFHCNGIIHCVEVLANRNLAISTRDNSIATSFFYYPNYILDINTERPLVYFKHRDFFTIIKELPNGDIITNGDVKNTLCLWNAETGECKRKISLTNIDVSFFLSPILYKLIVIDNDIIAVSYNYWHESSPGIKVPKETNYYFIKITDGSLIKEIPASELPKELLPSKTSEVRLPNGDMATYSCKDFTIDFIDIYDGITRQRKLHNPCHNKNNHREPSLINVFPDGNLIFTIRGSHLNHFFDTNSSESYIYLLKFPIQQKKLQNDSELSTVKPRQA